MKRPARGPRRQIAVEMPVELAGTDQAVRLCRHGQGGLERGEHLGSGELDELVVQEVLADQVVGKPGLSGMTGRQTLAKRSRSWNQRTFSRTLSMP